MYKTLIDFLQSTGFHDNTECVYWNFEADNGRGDWSSEGCTLASQNDIEVVCQCDHLTNFAVLTVIQYIKHTFTFIV